MVVPDDMPIMLFADADAFESWVEQNSTASGVWLKIARKSAPVASVTYDEALDVALCHGWIDGQRRSLDEHHFLQRFTPRRKRSIWSQRNVAKVAVLIAEGRMRAGGQKEIEAAQADGRWDRAYAASSVIEVPDDFQAAMNANPKAKAFFDSLNKTQRYPFLFRIETAKKAETRQRRIAQFVELLAEGKML